MNKKTAVVIDYIREDECAELYRLFCRWDLNISFDYDIFKSSFDRIVRDGKGVILVARMDGSIAGYAEMFQYFELGFNPFYEVADLLVSPEARNLGIGKLLMKRVEEVAAENGFNEIRLSSQVHRTLAHVFYENLGYEYYKVSKFYRKKF